MWVLMIVLLWGWPAFAGTCQDVGGTVRCTDDVGHNSTLQSLDQALGTQSPVTIPSSYPNELRSYPSEMKSQDKEREGKQFQSLPDDDSQKTTLQGQNPKGRAR